MKNLAKKVQEVSERIDNLSNTFDELLDIIKDFVNYNSCVYDNRGYCQTHNWFTAEKECPHSRAKRILGES